VTTQRTGTTDPQAIGAGDKELPRGSEVGEYQIDVAIGRGGFGTVYRAVQPVIGKQVAIKVLARKFAADEAMVERFVREARAVNQIRHRNIIDIFSFGQLPDGRHYYVMELLDGEPLDVYLRECGTMPLAEAQPILRSIARALDAAHAKGIAHRDLKPENIFLAKDPDGGRFPKLLDFGIAKLMTPDDDPRLKTGTGVPIGTPYYMSPEQCRGKDVDHRTDIYSFGIVAYRLLTGTYPFDGDYIELLTKQIGEEPELPSARNPVLPPSVDRAIAWMMQKDPAQRPRTVIAGVLALEDTGTAQTTPSMTPTPPSGIVPSQTAPRSSVNAAVSVSTGLGGERRRRGWLAKLAAVAVVGGAAATAWYMTRDHREPAAQTAPAPQPPDKVAHDPTPLPPTKQDPPPSQPQPPAVPDHVFVQLSGAPDGAVVSMSGRAVGLAPRVQLPYSTQELMLLVEADGYGPVQFSVVPDQDREVKVKMTAKKKVTRGALGHAHPNPNSGSAHEAGSAAERDDLPDHF
jgi:serine/threonine protein kinase